MSAYADRREWIKRLRDFMDGPNAGTCPVCHTNPEQAIERHRREVERLRGALMMIAGQENTHVFYEDGDSTLVLDAEDKQRRIARMALSDTEGGSDGR